MTVEPAGRALPGPGFTSAARPTSTFDRRAWRVSISNPDSWSAFQASCSVRPATVGTSTLPDAIWSDDRRARYMATTAVEAAALSKRLEELLVRRRELSPLSGSTSSQSKPTLPLYVFLVADDSLADAMPVLA